MFYVRAIYENGITVETEALSEREAIGKAKELLNAKDAEYETVRVVGLNGRLIFEEPVRRA